MQIAPSEAEEKVLAAWLKQPGNAAGDLAEAERWLAAICRIPSFRGKASALLFQLQLDGMLGEALASLAVIAAACQQVRYCICFEHLRHCNA